MSAMSIEALKRRVSLAFVRLLIRLNLIEDKGSEWEENDDE